VIRRTHVEPFLREVDGRIEVELLRDPGDGRVLRFLDRLCRLVRRLEGSPRDVVLEALARQERRIRDVRRLDGISRTLTDHCRFRPVDGAERAPEIRRALYEARGQRWPPVPGDERVPYEEVGTTLALEPSDVDRLLFADDPGAYELVRAPRFDGSGLLARYNMDLSRAVLLDAERMVVTARDGWRGIFRAVKLARLMYRLAPMGEGGYRLELTGPAASFVTSRRRYGTRFARVVPAVTRATGWRIEGEVVRGERTRRYVLDGRTSGVRSGRAGGSPTYDSAWERDLAAEFEEKVGTERDGWTLSREETPVALGEDLFLPDFTVRHADGRTALVEIVGFWAPEYLETKLDKVRRAGLDNLVLVVYRGLAAGEGSEEAVEVAGAGEVVWFVERPLIGPVMEAVERVAG